MTAMSATHPAAQAHGLRVVAIVLAFAAVVLAGLFVADAAGLVPTTDRYGSDPASYLSLQTLDGRAADTASR